jgi:hypothetical protein
VFCTLNTIGKHQDKELRIKYKERTIKNPAGGMDVCAACFKLKQNGKMDNQDK